jgi:hypothetical protein
VKAAFAESILKSPAPTAQLPGTPFLGHQHSPNWRCVLCLDGCILPHATECRLMTVAEKRNPG